MSHLKIWTVSTLLVLFVPLQLNAQVDQIVEWGKQQAITKAQDAVFAEVGHSLGLDAPILLNQNDAFPEVEDLTEFRPTVLNPTSIEDLEAKLPPGDYSIQVIGYCTHTSSHYPGRGLAYKLAPLKGKQSKAMAALLLRGMLRGVSRSDLQMAAWYIQWGVPPSNMSPSAQLLIHTLIPEYEQSLEGDFLANIEATYNKYKLLPSMPSLDTLLAKTEAGRAVLNIQQARQTLADRTIAAENLPDRLYQPIGDGLPRVLPPADPPQKSPWGEIRPGVYARFTFEHGFEDQNLLEFRITPKALTSRYSAPSRFVHVSFAPPIAAGGISIDGVLGLGELLPGAGLLIGAGLAGWEVGSLIAYAINANAQPLTIVPVVSMQSSPTEAPDFPDDVKQRTSGCTPGRLICVPATSVRAKGGTSCEQEFICPNGIVTVHWVTNAKGKLIDGPHWRPGPAKGK
jgi:hypothetical protein